jgi:hypothetical protein
MYNYRIIIISFLFLVSGCKKVEPEFPKHLHIWSLHLTDTHTTLYIANNEIDSNYLLVSKVFPELGPYTPTEAYQFPEDIFLNSEDSCTFMFEDNSAIEFDMVIDVDSSETSPIIQYSIELYNPNQTIQGLYNGEYNFSGSAVYFYSSANDSSWYKYYLGKEPILDKQLEEGDSLIIGKIEIAYNKFPWYY